MYAIIETGGKQYKVQEGLVFNVEKLEAETGSEVVLDKVLAVGSGADMTFGQPYVRSAKVTVEVVDHGRGEKILVFKKRRRKDSKKTQGHRQDFTRLKVKTISA